MDLHYRAQGVAPCGLCKTAIVQSYCDYCHVNLCKACVGEHISDEYEQHKIVPFQQQRSTLIYPKCETHPEKACKYHCKDCNISLCSRCIASKQHNKKHEFLKLEEVFNRKKKNIQRDIQELEREILPAYEKITIELQNQFSSYDDDYKKLTTEMSKQRKELHREIDNAFNEMGKENFEIQLKHHSILRKHLDEIKHKQLLIQQTILALNELKKSNEVITTIQYSSKNQEFSTLPPKVQVSVPIFIPKQINREEIWRLIGKSTPLSTSQVRVFTAPKRIFIPRLIHREKLSTTLDERVPTAKKPHASEVKELLDEPEVLHTIQTGYEYLYNVTLLNEEQIWTSGEKAEIRCFNIQGVLQKTINAKVQRQPTDLAVARDGALLYTIGMLNIVYKVKNDQTEEIINLQGWIPSRLCVTSSGDLLVTMYCYDGTQSKVVRYSGSTVKQTIQFDDKGQPLFSRNFCTKYISENRNLDICVSDWAARAVVVVNQAGKLRFRYTGHPSRTKNKAFRPYGITTDSQSRILTVDFLNQCIHILDAEGEFLRYIDNDDLGFPYSLCIDRNDSLFVCELYTGSVKKIRY